MKNEYGASIVFALLMTACGANRADRYGASAIETGSKQESRSSTAVLNPTNYLREAREWVADDGEKYTIIGKFTQLELGNISLSGSEDSREIGTLSYIRTHTDFKESYPTDDTVPTDTVASHDSKLKVFLVRAGENLGELMVALKSGKGVDELLDTRTPIEVRADFRNVCIAVKVPEVHAPPVASSSIILEGLITPPQTVGCPLGICFLIFIRTLGAETEMITPDEAITKYSAICSTQERRATRFYHLTNTSHVSSFQIKLTGESKLIASEIDFVNSL